MRKAAVAGELALPSGDVLRADLTVGGFAAISHVDSDIGDFTLCSVADDGEVLGGFHCGGWYVPLHHGSLFAFDARVRHSMCGDHPRSAGAMRYSTATWLSKRLVTHGHAGAFAPARHKRGKRAKRAELAGDVAA